MLGRFANLTRRPITSALSRHTQIGRYFSPRKSNSSDEPRRSGELGKFDKWTLYELTFNQKLKLNDFGNLPWYFGIGLAATAAIQLNFFIGIGVVFGGVYLMAKNRMGNKKVYNKALTVTKIDLDPSMAWVHFYVGIQNPMVFSALITNVSSEFYSEQSDPDKFIELLVSAVDQQGGEWKVLVPVPKVITDDGTFIGNKDLLLEVLNGEQNNVYGYKYVGK